MKRFTLGILALVLATGIASAQTSSLKVDITELSQQELLNYQALQKKANANQFNMKNLSPDKISQYGQIGKGFGQAFKECWSTVSDDAEKFAQSDAGKITMFLIGWKIMGEDAINVANKLIHYTTGIFSYFIFIGVWIYMYRRLITDTYKVESVSGWWFWKKKVYSDTIKRKAMISAMNDEAGFHLLMWLCLIILIGLASWITFAG